MIKKGTGVFFIIFMLYELAGCTAAGPPPPLPGPNPILDRVFFYLQYFFPFFIFIFFCSLIALGFYLFLFKNSSLRRGMGKNIPIEIAGERYARGELSRDEYMRIIKDLKFTDGKEKELDEYRDL